MIQNTYAFSFFFLYKTIQIEDYLSRLLLITGMNPETRAAGMVADLMVLSARTAPKGKATDSISAVVKTGDELKSLAEEMKRIGERDEMGFFIRDAGNIPGGGVSVPPRAPETPPSGGVFVPDLERFGPSTHR